MKIGLLSHGSRGDIQPLLALGAELRARGHQIQLGAPPNFAADAMRYDFAFLPVGHDAETYIREHAGEYTGMLRGTHVVYKMMRDEVEGQFEALPDLLRGCDIIVGAGLQLAAPSIAEHLGIPYRYLVYCPALLKSRQHAPILLPVTGLPQWCNLPVWAMMQMAYNLSLLPLVNRLRHRLALPPVRDLYHHVVSSHSLLATDSILSPLPDDSSPRALQTGYLLPDMAKQALPNALEAFLDAGEPPVYIGFGSMGCPHPEQTTALLIEAVAQAKCRAVLAKGWAGLGEGNAIPDHIHVVGNVPHTQLFSRMAAVVHHGGAGTTATAARAGVPQIIVPHISDQFYWAKRVQALNISPQPIHRAELSAGALAGALRQTLRDSVMKSAAAQIARVLANTHPLQRAADAVLCS